MIRYRAAIPRLIAMNEQDARDAAEYPLGTIIPLGAPFDELVASWHSWSDAERIGRWSSGNLSSLTLALSPAAARRNDLALTVAFHMFAPACHGQRIEILVNDTLLHGLDVPAGDMQPYVLKLPLPTPGRAPRITFHFPDAASPSALGYAADNRSLGGFFYWILVDQDAALPPARSMPEHARLIGFPAPVPAGGVALPDAAEAVDAVAAEPAETMPSAPPVTPAGAEPAEVAPAPVPATAKRGGLIARLRAAWRGEKADESDRLDRLAREQETLTHALRDVAERQTHIEQGLALLEAAVQTRLGQAEARLGAMADRLDALPTVLAGDLDRLAEGVAATLKAATATISREAELNAVRTRRQVAALGDSMSDAIRQDAQAEAVHFDTMIRLQRQIDGRIGGLSGMSEDGGRHMISAHQKLDALINRKIIMVDEALVALRVHAGYVILPRADLLLIFFLIEGAGVYEPGTQTIFHHLVEPGMHVVDVGANIGIHTLTLARLVGEDGRVTAIEPAPAIFRLLSRTMEANSLESIVRLIDKAASSKAGTATLNIGHTSGHSSLLPLGRSDQSVVVETCALDEILTGPVDLVKIDVEGMELEVIAGMTGILADPDIVLIAEFGWSHMRRLETDADSWFGAFADRGFTAFRIVEALDVKLHETLSPESAEDGNYLFVRPESRLWPRVMEIVETH